MEPFVYDPAAPHLGGNIDGGDKFTYCPRTWDWLVKTYNIRTVLDVGCGQGHAQEYFESIGCHTTGIEGLAANAENNKHNVIIHDIQVDPLILPIVDLVWCCELVEHIEEQYLDNLLQTIYVGRVLAMTHAVPGQDGHHHVNCQEKEYWIKALADYGMVYDAEATEEAKKQDAHNNHFMWHGLIFEKDL